MISLNLAILLHTESTRLRNEFLLSMVTPEYEKHSTVSINFPIKEILKNLDGLTKGRNLYAFGSRVSFLVLHHLSNFNRLTSVAIFFFSFNLMYK